MILRNAYVRFYRTFNYDYLRKRHYNAKPDPWDQMEDGTFYPYVRLPVDREFTAVVGANESGKSQLLLAVECALGMSQPTPADFCRHSSYFTVAESMRIPHFGLQFDELSADETESVCTALSLEDPENLSSFRIFRTGPD
ncbi:MAG: OLD family endonuclease, partial [Chloroflexi bacterium]|nr:OLD family endonuclease [Chloroflexota bacterium]